MRNFLLLILALIAILGSILFLNREKIDGVGLRIGTNDNPLMGTEKTPATDSSLVVAPTSITASPNPSSAINPPSSPATNTPAIEPTTVLDNCRVIIHNYNTAFGENPVGDNAEITAALMGNNPKGVNFLRADSGLRVNAKGELLDGHGTPFFFHQVSAKVMEIRSAGLDKILWSFDDEVTR